MGLLNIKSGNTLERSSIKFKPETHQNNCNREKKKNHNGGYEMEGEETKERKGSGSCCGQVEKIPEIDRKGQGDDGIPTDQKS